MFTYQLIFSQPTEVRGEFGYRTASLAATGDAVRRH
jgi:hypothetical protein